MRENQPKIEKKLLESIKNERNLDYLSKNQANKILPLD